MGRRSVLAAVCCGALALLGVPAPALAQREVPPLFRPPAAPHLPSRHAQPSNLLEVDEDAEDLLDNLETAWEIGSNFQSCIEAGGSAEDCLARILLCDILPMGASAYYGHIGGSFATTLIEELQIFGAFRTTACGNDCFWCCLTPTGCHTSFGPSPVINCNARYGVGSRTLGHTLITTIPMGTTACLSLPQTCDLYSQCVISGSRGYPGGLPTPPPVGAPPPRAYGGYYTPEPMPTFTPLHGGVPDAGVTDAGAPDGDAPRVDGSEAGLDPSWTPPRGVRELRPRPDTPMPVLDAIAERKVRMFAESVARVTAEVLDSIPPDHALDELSDLFTMRGCVGHRSLLAHGEPFDGTRAAFGVALTNPRVRDRVSARRALHFLAMIRVLGSVPNLRNRFVHVESRLWTASERAEYLRAGGVVDADRTLRETMSGLSLRILQRVDGLQDYRLLAVPLPGEATGVRRYNGCRLGTAPQVTVAARNEGNDVVLDVTAAETDPPDPRIRALPVAIEWGDDTTTRGALPTATMRASYRHTYRQAGRYAAVVAVAGQSGLHGLAGLVFDAMRGDPMAPRAIGFERVTFPNLQVFAGATGNRAPGNVTASLSLVRGARARRIGRAPSRAVEVRQATTTGGVETVVNPGLTSLGDLVGFNPGRAVASHLDLRVSLRDATAWDGRSIELRLRDLRFDLFSARRGVGVAHAVRLTPATLRAYYGAPPMAVTMPLPTDADGTVRVPLVRPGSTNARTPLLDHVEIDLDPLLATADLSAPPLTETPAGVRRRWSELRPGVLEAGPVEGLPAPEDAGVDGGPSRDATASSDGMSASDAPTAPDAIVALDATTPLDGATPRDATTPPDAMASLDAPASADASSDGAAPGDDVGRAAGGDGGCGCRARGDDVGGWRGLAVALGAALLRRRRRGRAVAPSSRGE